MNPRQQLLDELCAERHRPVPPPGDNISPRVRRWILINELDDEAESEESDAA